MNPTILTDININLICGLLRKTLQERAFEIEGDMRRNQRKTMEIEFNLELIEKSDGIPPGCRMTAKWVPKVCRANHSIALEDPRQTALFGGIAG